MYFHFSTVKYKNSKFYLDPNFSTIICRSIFDSFSEQIKLFFFTISNVFRHVYRSMQYRGYEKS